MAANPYVYGKPVPIDRFINRTGELRTLFDRLRNGESTALVGEPRIGRTSLLLQFQDPKNQQTYLGSRAAQFILKYVDLSDSDDDFTPAALWAEALESLEETGSLHDHIRECLREAKKAGYERRPLINLFKTLADSKLCLVLLLDEFDCLTLRPHFQSHEFFARLRMLSTITGGLAVITASRWTVARLNHWGRDMQIAGSPLFNHMTEERLLPFEERHIVELLDLAGNRFDDVDRRFIRRVAGRHPYLCQAAGAIMFTETDSGSARYAKAGRRFYRRIESHFDDLWESLDDKARTTAVILSLVELGGRAIGGTFSYGEIEKVAAFGPELQRLEDLGLVDRVGRRGWQFDTESLLLWQGKKRTISAQAFTWWVRDVVIAESRKVPSYDEWLSSHRYRGLLTQQQWDSLLHRVQSLPGWARRGAGALARLLAEQLL